MRTKLSDGQSSCITIQSKHTRSWQRHDEGMKTAWRFLDVLYDLVFEGRFVNFTGRRAK